MRPERRLSGRNGGAAPSRPKVRAWMPWFCLTEEKRSRVSAWLRRVRLCRSEVAIRWGWRSPHSGWHRLTAYGILFRATLRAGIWCGEQFSESADFFSPICVEHMIEELPLVADFLALPQGYRFLIADGYRDIWFDASLLQV